MFGSSVDISEALFYMSCPPLKVLKFETETDRSENYIWNVRFVYKGLLKNWKNMRQNSPITVMRVVMNRGAYCYICSMWCTLIVVWMVEGREAGGLMTALLSWQLSLPRWKRLESTVKNASEIYRPAVGPCIRGGEAWMVPSGRGPSLWLHGEITEEHNRGTMQRQRRLCFCQFLQEQHGFMNHQVPDCYL